MTHSHGVIQIFAVIVSFADWRIVLAIRFCIWYTTHVVETVWFLTMPQIDHVIDPSLALVDPNPSIGISFQFME
jgi:CxxC-x17-CxxC domain-containing protein